MTCVLTAAEDTDYAPTYSLAPNKWYLKIYINTRNPEKITKGSKCRGSHQRRGTTSSTVHSHSKDRLYLPQMQWLVYNPLVDHSQAIYVVLKRPGKSEIDESYTTLSGPVCTHDIVRCCMFVVHFFVWLRASIL